RDRLTGFVLNPARNCRRRIQFEGDVADLFSAMKNQITPRAIARSLAIFLAKKPVLGDTNAIRTRRQIAKHKMASGIGPRNAWSFWAIRQFDTCIGDGLSHDGGMGQDETVNGSIRTRRLQEERQDDEDHHWNAAAVSSAGMAVNCKVTRPDSSTVTGTPRVA